MDVDVALQMRDDFPGVYIDEQERISGDQDYDSYVYDLFVIQMERIFYKAPKDISLESADEEIPILPRFRDYLFGILPLFTEVLNTEVKYNAFDVIPTDRAERLTEYASLLKLVTEILLKPIGSGSQINDYVNDIKHAPHYIRRLIEKKGSNFYLKSVDINSYEYEFALFSLMLFKNDEHDKLLELKMFEWERRHKAD